MEAAYPGMWACLGLVLLTSTVATQNYRHSPPQKMSPDTNRPMQCPLACRCSQIRPGHELLRRWEDLKSPADIRMLENAIDQGHWFRRDFSSGSSRAVSGRDMMCMGLVDLPSSIPSDIIRLSIFGEEGQSNQSRDSISYGHPHKPSSIAARGTAIHSNNQLSTIRKSAFMRSRDLLELSIVGNDVRYISPAEFEYLPNLVLLNLQNNNLKSLETQTFQGLYHLEELRLSKNGLHILPSGLLDNVPRLKKLYVDENQIRSLDIDTFHSLRNLEILDLSSNNLTYLPRTVFARNRHLRELSMDDNMFDGIQSDWFSHALQLQKLSMNGNRLSSLGPGSLTVVRMLSDLSLSGNRIIRIHARTLNSFHSLRRLDLGYNNIGAIPAGTFHGTPKLTELNLAGNKLILIARDVFGRPSALKILDLSNNNLDTVSRENFKDLNALEKLDLSGNGITDLVNGTFSGLRKLRELNLARNKIHAIEHSSLAVSLSRFVSQLTWLNLQHNQISSITGESFRTVPHLKFLNLAFNHITFIDGKAFHSQQQLNTLLLNNNLLSSLRGGIFSSLKNVRHLNVGYNQLKDLSGTVLKGLTRLDELNAQQNRLSLLMKDLFHEIPNLVRANFSGNSIHYVNMNSLFPSSSLSHLDLSRNNLSEVKASPSFGLRLKHLSLAENRLKSLHSDISNSMATGGELSLVKNPWLCDCHLSWFRYLVPIWQLQLADADQLACDQPRELRGQRILSLGQSDFTCSSPVARQGSPAIRPPVKERHNYPSQDRTIMAPKSRYPRVHQNNPMLTTTLRNILPLSTSKYQGDPRSKYQGGPRSKYSNRNVLSNHNANHGSKKNRVRKKSGVTKPLVDTLRRANKRFIPISPRPNILVDSRDRSRIHSGSGLSGRTFDSRGTTTPSPWSRSNRRKPFTERPRPTISTSRPTQRSDVHYPGRRRWKTTRRPIIPREFTTKRPQARRGFSTRGTSQNYSSKREFDKERRNQKGEFGGPRLYEHDYDKGNNSGTETWWNPPSLFHRIPSPTVGTTTPRRQIVKVTPKVPTRIRNPIYPRKPNRSPIPNPQTKPPLRDRANVRNFNRLSALTPRPDRFRRPYRVPSYTSRPLSNKSFKNETYDTAKPGANPPYDQKQPAVRPYVLTTLKPKQTLRPKFPNVYPRGTSTSTTIFPPKVVTQKTRKTTDTRRKESVLLGCRFQSKWRLHFDKALIRRHKSEVKNYHVTVLNSRRKPTCNAVLLTDWWILTTASCVEKNLANPGKLRDPSWSPNYHVKIGLRELNKATGIVVHPAYLSRRSQDHDFALLKLKYDSLMTKAFTPPCVMSSAWFQGRSAWVVPGVASARFDSKKPRSNLQTMAVKVWETDCDKNPASCLRITNKDLNSESAFTDGAPLYLGYSKSRWSLVGLGRSSTTATTVSKYLPVWTVLDWLKTVVSS